MTGKIVNLRQERKRRERKQAEGEAADNRRRFGRTKAEKAADAAADAERRKSSARLEGHRLGDEAAAPEEDG